MKEFIPNHETSLCLSLAGHPGTFGARFHNFLFRRLGLNFFYLPRKTDNLESSVKGLLNLNVRGSGVSMPFKVAVVPFMDSLDESARRAGAVNTILVQSTQLLGFNTDVLAIRQLIRSSPLAPNSRILVLGSGGMARAILAALNAENFKSVRVMVRSFNCAPELELHFDCEVIPWGTPLQKQDLIVNATSLGFRQSGIHLPAQLEGLIPLSNLIWDAVATPHETAFIRQASAAGCKVVAGSTIAKLQAQQQFSLYTGIVPSEEDINAALSFAEQDFT